MTKIVPIVEGDGEVEAVPTLLSKILAEMGRYDVQVERPRNAKGCKNLMKPAGLEGFVELAATVPGCGAVLILMDADKECAKGLAQEFSKRVLALKVHRPVVIVIANREYEAWFLASLETIAGKELQGRQGFPIGLTYSKPDGVEEIVGVKGWLSSQLPQNRAYKPAEDQAALTRMIDTTLARQRSRSFRRLCHAVAEAVQAIDSGQPCVTPAPTEEGPSARA